MLAGQLETLLYQPNISCSTDHYIAKKQFGSLLLLSENIHSFCCQPEEEEPVN